ncbi:MAG TPA: exosortase-associated EpsI family protein [Phycisphaerae bacterium]|nr:exosortase-associated EpsI family protein [Phycisphaerae bacterium]HNU44116.1 exosortase-associated EpsI family protein [Phycisphaerae bacterium]
MATHNRSGLAALLTPQFLVAVLLLGAGAVLAGPFSRHMAFRRIKEPLPLRAPLTTLDANALQPYRVIQRGVLDPAVVDQLGTEEYLSWVLEDTSVPENDPLRHVTLFITYYTGGHNLAPHNPDMCFLGAGYSVAQPHENAVATVATLPPRDRDVPIRVCTFVKTAVFGREQTTVIYTYYCNGDFVATRDAVRLRVNNPLATHAYFSKVEVSFIRAARERSIAGVGKVFERLLPLLVDRHWPDRGAAEAAKTKSPGGEPQGTGR